MTPKKKATKKKSTSTRSRASQPQVERTTTTPNQPHGEVFTTEPEPAQSVKVPSGSVALFVKGQDKGIVDGKNPRTGQLFANVAEFVLFHAQNAGIKRFSAYADGVKLDTADGGQPLSRYIKLEIVPKDSRG